VPNKFLSLLAEKSLIGQDQVSEIEKEAKEKDLKPTQILQEKDWINGDELAKALAEYLKLPYVNLSDREIKKSAIEIVPVESAKTYLFAPFEIDQDKKIVKIAMIDPENLEALEALEFLTESKGLSSEIYVASKEGLFSALKIYELGLSQEIGAALEQRGAEERKEEEGRKKRDKSFKKGEDKTEISSEEGAITKLVDTLVKHAVEQKASDIHIEPLEDKVKVRYRIDGVLEVSTILPKNVQEAIVARIKIMTSLKIDESRIPQDGRFHQLILGRPYDFRVSILPTVNGEKVAIRILDKATTKLSLEDLGFTGKRLKDLKDAIHKPHGIMLITGPTGSGKSTTLYILLRILNVEGVNISTLEDPVEYYIEGINQSNINTAVKFDFASGLRSLLRQDPDVLMVGEIRDKETAEMSIHAALTGHIVLSTLHTNTAEAAMPRLIDMDIEPFLLTSSVNIIVAQRLVRKICQDCKTEHSISSELKNAVEKEFKMIPAIEKKEAGIQDVSASQFKFYYGKGCKGCRLTGYKGRLAIVSVILSNVDFQQAVLERATSYALAEIARSLGILTMRQDGILKVLQGLTTVEEVFSVTKESEDEIMEKNKKVKHIKIK